MTVYYTRISKDLRGRFKVYQRPLYECASHKDDIQVGVMTVGQSALNANEQDGDCSKRSIVKTINAMMKHRIETIRKMEKEIEQLKKLREKYL